MSDEETFYYDEKHFRNDVGDLTGPEISLLADNYPSYRLKDWRMTLLKGIKEGWDNDQILLNKIIDKEIDVDTDQSKGGHAKMIPFKIRRAAFRLLYIRYRLDDKTQTQANRLIRTENFPDVKADTILKNTRGCLLDKKK